MSSPIGIFDSGYGGLTILDGIRSRLPQYDYIYLGDNARAPYGTRSFDVVYEFTLQAVKKLFEMGCPLIILGCNTASAKALRSIQQNYSNRRSCGRHFTQSPHRCACHGRHHQERKLQARNRETSPRFQCHRTGLSDVGFSR